MNEQDQMKKFWVNVANYYRQTIPNETIAMYAYDTRTLTLEELRKAFDIYRTSKQAAFFPIPAVLKNLIRPEPDMNSEANEIAGRIREASNRFGYMQGNEAQEFMGELAWSVVQGFGGWLAICESQDEPSKWAQMRELARAKMIRAAQGRSDVVPGLGLPGVSDRSKIDQATNQDAPRLNEKVVSLVSTSLEGKKI